MWESVLSCHHIGSGDWTRSLGWAVSLPTDPSYQSCIWFTPSNLFFMVIIKMLPADHNRVHIIKLIFIDVFWWVWHIGFNYHGRSHHYDWLHHTPLCPPAPHKIILHHCSVDSGLHNIMFEILWPSSRQANSRFYFSYWECYYTGSGFSDSLVPTLWTRDLVSSSESQAPNN